MASKRLTVNAPDEYIATRALRMELDRRGIETGPLIAHAAGQAPDDQVALAVTNRGPNRTFVVVFDERPRTDR